MNVKKALLFDMDVVVIGVPGISIEQIKSWGSPSSRQFWTKTKNDFSVSEDFGVLVDSYS